MSDRPIEMTPERVARMMTIADLGLVFASNPLRMRFLAAKVMARAVTNDEVYDLLRAAVSEPLPSEEPPVNGRQV